MNWDNIELWDYNKLDSDSLIGEFEGLIKYVFPDDFKDFVLQYNWARPEKDTFDTKVTEGRDIMAISSFNKEDIETIWNSYEWDEECEEFKGFTGRYIPFAFSNCGDDICFDASNNHIVYIDHETAEVEEVADTFTEFINSLYEYEE